MKLDFVGHVIYSMGRAMIFPVLHALKRLRQTQVDLYPGDIDLLEEQ